MRQVAWFINNSVDSCVSRAFGPTGRDFRFYTTGPNSFRPALRDSNAGSNLSGISRGMILPLFVDNPCQASSHPAEMQYRIHIPDDLNNHKPEYDAPPMLRARKHHVRDNQCGRPQMSCFCPFNLGLHLGRITRVTLQIDQRLQIAERSPAEQLAKG